MRYTLEQLRLAYRAGFMASGEGYNYEFPFEQNEVDPTEDKLWCKLRDKTLSVIGNKSTSIVCTHCGKIARVYHFDWSALQCQHCQRMVNKDNWLIGDEMTDLECRWHTYANLHDGEILPFHEWLEK